MNTTKLAFLAAAALSFFSTVALSDIKLGAPFALSGSVAKLAEQMQAGALLAADHVNSQGGVLGEPLNLVFADSACDPDKAVEVVTELINNSNVSAIIGPVCSGATLRQAQSVSIPAGVVTLSVASASFLISNLRDDDLVFRTAMSDAYKGKVMAQYVFSKGINHIAVSFASDAYNTGVAKVFTRAFTELGGQVTVSQAHQVNQKTYEREVAALAAGAEHVAVFAYYGSSGTQLLHDIFDSGKFQSIFGSDGMLSQELIDTFGDVALQNTFILTNSADDSREAFKVWQSLLKDTDVLAEGAYVPNSYDAVFMMALAIEAMGSAERDVISSGLRAISGPEGNVILPGEYAKARELLQKGEKVNYDGASGNVDFDSKGDVSGSVSVNIVTDGQWQSTLVKF